jgi:hypothetical protein
MALGVLAKLVVFFTFTAALSMLSEAFTAHGSSLFILSLILLLVSFVPLLRLNRKARKGSSGDLGEFTRGRAVRYFLVNPSLEVSESTQLAGSGVDVNVRVPQGKDATIHASGESTYGPDYEWTGPVPLLKFHLPTYKMNLATKQGASELTAALKRPVYALVVNARRDGSVYTFTTYQSKGRYRMYRAGMYLMFKGTELGGLVNP